jgi:hypothetical protein
MARERRRLASAGQRALVAGATLGASAVFATSAQATGNTYTVTTNGDDSPPVACDTSNNCATLRDAINAANNDGGNDTIQFDSSLAGQTITLTNGTLSITQGGITIQNPNAPGLAVSGNMTSQVFFNGAPAGTTTTISGLTIEDGSSSIGGAIETPYTSGGGAALMLSNDVIQGSRALGGGGVFADGPLTISGSTITGNTALIPGGGVSSKYGPASITDSTISNNTAKYGAGVFARGSLSVSGSQITGNTKPSTDTNGRGGGISAYGGPLSVTNTTISNNTSGVGGGISDYSYSGATLSNLTVSGNTGTNDGGGIRLAGDNPRQAASRLAALRAALAKQLSTTLPPQQAAPAITTPGPMKISDSTISGNSSPNGAGLDVPYTDYASQSVTVSASTLSDNTATATAPANSFGGGILVGESGSIVSPFQLIDSTISGNSADNGGGVSIGNGSYAVLGTNGSINFNNSTIASNTANLSGGGIYLSDYSTTSGQQSATAGILSTVVARDTAAGTGNDLAQASGSTSGGFNASYSLIQQPGNAPLLSQQSLIKGVDPQLGSLANNGGPTQTMLPTFTSPVIDQGKNSVDQSTGQPLSTDQRGPGFARTVDNGKPKPPGGDGTDIGAVEVQKIPILAIIEPATNITAWQATLNGKINTNAQAVTWHFQYGTSTSYGSVTPSESISAGHGQVPVSFGVSGLHPHTLYHYRLVAMAANGSTSDSADATFETLTPTIHAQPRTVLAGNKVRLHGFAGGCPTGDRVTLISRAFFAHHMYRGRPAVYAIVKSGGSYSVNTRIPKGRKAGRYAITARCGGNSFATTAFLRVTRPAPKVKPVAVVKFTG